MNDLFRSDERTPARGNDKITGEHGGAMASRGSILLPVAVAAMKFL